MSASSKKKLRSQLDSGKLTEKQLEERKKDQEVKMYTIGFTVVMALILVVAIVVGGMKIYENSGVRERKTIAYTVGEHQISNAEMNYFFTDTVNNFSQQYGPYAAMFGLDTSKPLDEQVYDQEKGTTWADDLMNQAKESAKAVYALADAARAEGHTLSESEMANVDMAMAQLDMYAQISGMGKAKTYLKAMYGNGATEESYRAYLENSVLADSYKAAHADTLTYEDAALRDHEKEIYNEYSSYSYRQYYLPVDQFLEGGKADEEGNMTFTQEEKDASQKAAEEAAKALTADTVKTPADLDKAIAGLSVNKEAGDQKSTSFTHKDYRSIPADAAKWLSEDARVSGDTTYIANTSVSENEDGESVTNTTGYTVLMFLEEDENTALLPNVRHILIGFEGGTANEQGQMVYSDEEKAAAKDKAEALLKQYEEGEKTEDAFAALASENTTDPGSKDKGGLYENVYQGQMVSSFNDWVFEDGRKTGDTGVVETEYGYHVMYFCGDGSLSYRDMLITSELKTADMEAWFDGLLEAVTAADGDLTYVNTSLILGR